MKNSSFLSLLRHAGLAALLAAPPLLAATYEYALGDPANRTLRLNIPASVPTVRGILVWGNGSNSDLRGMAADPEFVALAESIGFAVLGTSMWDAFFPGTPDEFTAFQAGIAQLAATSGHPELNGVPWLPVGHSNGGCMSYGSNTLQPARTIAMAANEGRGYNNTRPAIAALATPGLLLAGGGDTEVRRAAVRDLFEGNRPRGALWAWAEQEGLAHEYGDSFELILPFAAAMYTRRYPAVASPQSGAVTLQTVPETEGWLVEPASHLSGLAEIAAYADYAHDRTTAGWLPSRRLAYIFRAYASHGKPTESATVDVGHGPVAWGTTVNYTLGTPAVAWSTIEYYEGDVLLRRATPADPNPLTVTHVPTAPGYSVYHALVTLADGTTRRTTPPRRVFVRAATPQAPTNFKDDIGFTALKSEYPDLPTGTNLTMLMGDFTSANTNWNWAVEPGAELAGKTITYLPPGTVPTGYSPHATGVTTIVAGNSSGLLPQLPTILSLWSENISTALLHLRENLAPTAPTWDFEVHTWTWTDDVYSTEIIRRMDWRIDQQGVTVVEAIGNDRTSPLAYCFTSGFNAIAVGVTSGAHNTGPTQIEGAGRAKPDIVAPTQYTSAATPTVASCAGLLIAKAKLDSALSLARDPRAVKALLLAGATKEQIPGWSHTPTQPLDAHFGAGQVNIANSYHLLLAGRQSAGNTWLSANGWDKTAGTGAANRYFFEIPAGQSATLSTALIWHRTITPNNNWSVLTPSLVDLNLHLSTATASFGVATTMAESSSTIDNVEHIYQANLTAGRYVLEVTGPAGTTYGLAWRSILSPHPEPVIATPPTAQSAASGASAFFSVEASGVPAPSYQWQRLAAGASAWTDLADGSGFSGTRSPALRVNGATSSMSGDKFRCVTTNSAGSATSAATTLTVTATPALLQRPTGLATDAAGNLLVTDTVQNTLKRVTSAGAIATLTGTIGSAGSQDGTGTAALFNQPGAVAIDASGNLFVADTANSTLRRSTATGVVTTLAGSASARGSADGTGAAASFNSPDGVAADSVGNVYLADTFNHTIRKVTTAGVVTTLAGTAGSSGETNGTGTAARFNNPKALAADGAGNLYVADTFNHTIRKVATDGSVTTLAGSAGISGTFDGTGPNALFNQPAGIAVDSAGNVFVADTGNCTIRKITTAGAVTTLAGDPGIAGWANGTGAAALFNQPRGIAVAAGGILCVADTGNGEIRRIAADGTVTTLALSAAPVPPPPPTPTTTIPPSPPTPPSSGGGALAPWFLLILLALGFTRRGMQKANPATLHWRRIGNRQSVAVVTLALVCLAFGAPSTALADSEPAAAKTSKTARPSIEIGMVAAQVRTIIGNPHRIKRLKHEDVAAEIWLYTYSRQIGMRQVPTGTRDTPIADPITGTMTILHDPIYGFEQTYLEETTELLMVGGVLVSAKRYQNTKRDFN